MLFKIICIIIAILIGILLTDAKLRPAIYELAALEAYAAANKTINSAVEKALSKSTVAYNELVSVTQTDNGSITGITTDIVKMNLFKSQITNAIDSTFKEINCVTVSIPLGTATGVVLFTGWKPDIKVKIGLSSSTYSTFENVFQSAGINQTQHNVMLNIKSDIILALPNRRINKIVETSFCVAQTVIVGTVPNVLVE